MNRFRHSLHPPYHCSASRIQPRHRRCHVHRFLPFRLPLLHDFCSPSVERIFAVEQTWNWSTKCSPLYLDILSAAQQLSALPLQCEVPHVMSWNIGRDHHRVRTRPRRRTANILSLGPLPQESIDIEWPPELEASYAKTLVRLSDDLLDIANSPSLAPATLRWRSASSLPPPPLVKESPSRTLGPSGRLFSLLRLGR